MNGQQFACNILPFKNEVNIFKVKFVSSNEVVDHFVAGSIFIISIILNKRMSACKAPAAIVVNELDNLIDGK
jgi:hypothetical protein